jgi:hypothetical protein
MRLQGKRETHAYADRILLNKDTFIISFQVSLRERIQLVTEFMLGKDCLL